MPTTLAGVRQMIKALRKGQAVGLLPDQVPPDGQGQSGAVFGQPAYTMTLAARLALQTGATVVLARCERLSWGRGFDSVFEDLPMPLPAEMDAAVLHLEPSHGTPDPPMPAAIPVGLWPLQTTAPRGPRHPRRAAA